MTDTSCSSAAATVGWRAKPASRQCRRTSCHAQAWKVDTVACSASGTRCCRRAANSLCARRLKVSTSTCSAGTPCSGWERSATATQITACWHAEQGHLPAQHRTFNRPPSHCTARAKRPAHLLQRKTHALQHPAINQFTEMISIQGCLQQRSARTVTGCWGHRTSCDGSGRPVGTQLTWLSCQCLLQPAR